MSQHHRSWRTPVSAVAVAVLSSFGAIGAAVPAHAEEPLQSCVFIISTGEAVCVDDAADLSEAAEDELGLELVVETEPAVDFGAEIESEAEALVNTAAVSTAASLSPSSPASSVEGTTAVASFSSTAKAGSPYVQPAASKVVTTAYVRTILYENSGYSGAIFTLADPQVCYNGNVARIANLHGYGWGDRVSGFASQYSCKTKLWHDINYSGTSYGPYVKKSYVLDKHNDKFSSVSTS